MKETKKQETLPQVCEQTTALATSSVAPVQEQLLASDLIIPRMVVLQGLSKTVAAGEGRIGDAIILGTNRKLSDEKMGMFGIIPLTYKSTWITEVKVGSKWKYVSQEPRHTGNEVLPEHMKKEYKGPDGQTYRKNRNFDVFVLLESDVLGMIESEKTGEFDIDKVVMPVLISFRRSSYFTGKSIVNFIQKVKGMQTRFPVAPYMFVRNLGSKSTTDDNGTYGVFVTNEISKKINDPAIIAQTKMWYDQLNSGNVQVAEEVAEVETIQEVEREDF